MLWPSITYAVQLWSNKYLIVKGVLLSFMWDYELYKYTRVSYIIYCYGHLSNWFVLKRGRMIRWCGICTESRCPALQCVIHKPHDGWYVSWRHHRAVCVVRHGHYHTYRSVLDHWPSLFNLQVCRSVSHGHVRSVLYNKTGLHMQNQRSWQVDTILDRCVSAHVAKACNVQFA